MIDTTTPKLANVLSVDRSHRSSPRSLVTSSEAGGAPGLVRAPSGQCPCGECPERRRASAVSKSFDRPQARTDLVIRPVNNSDQLLENAVSAEIFRLFQSTLLRQSPVGPSRNLF